jgi:glutamate-5-semialdehyde dehydrogenase
VVHSRTLGAVSAPARSDSRPGSPLTGLVPGQLVPFGGDRVAVVDAELAARFAAGDRLVVVHDTGDLLHIPLAEHQLVHDAVGNAAAAFTELAAADDQQLTAFFGEFADRLADDRIFDIIEQANVADVAAALARQRSTTRLTLSASMRQGMIDGLRVWQRTDSPRDLLRTTHDHGTWQVETRRAPLGVVGFVFEGRPNVFADATGVLRTGNTVVFRIGSDALGTARAIMTHAVVPSLERAGLPVGAVQLVDSASHAAGWALFADERLGLAVARGSGTAVAQLGAVARQHGVPVSLHGTGGAWMVVAADAAADSVHAAVLHSLDRKVCNTLNVCCVVAGAAERLVPVVVGAACATAATRGVAPVLHVAASAAPFVDHPFTPLDPHELAIEWEWEDVPELSIVVVDAIDDAVVLFNAHSPRFAASLLGGDAEAQQHFYDTVDAPFVGDGFTRWVDGQFAFDQPELGLSNWQAGRLFQRAGVLSGDSVFTVRTRAHIRDHTVHR